MKLGLLLPNQGVVFGATTVPELLELAEQAEGSGIFKSLWVGDNLLAKPVSYTHLTLPTILLV